MANDTDAEGDSLTAVLVAGPSHGTLSLNANGGFTFTLAANYNGSDSFTYIVSDGHGGTATGTVNITVNPVNDNPVAVDDSAATDEDTAVTVDVVANDTDPDGEQWTG